MRCLIITGGTLDLSFAGRFLERQTFEQYIAVDGGLEAAKALGIVPDYVVGDFDTVKTPVLEEFLRIPSIVWERHRPEKNETDTELARSLALNLGASELVFLGATGGRIDHMLANLHTLYACMEQGVEAYLVDAQNRVCLIQKEKIFQKDLIWGKYVSFLPYTETVSGITLEGFRYPLFGKTICRGIEPGLCISNEVTAKQARVTLESGILLCVESRDENWTA